MGINLPSKVWTIVNLSTRSYSSDSSREVPEITNVKPLIFNIYPQQLGFFDMFRSSIQRTGSLSQRLVPPPEL